MGDREKADIQSFVQRARRYGLPNVALLTRIAALADFEVAPDEKKETTLLGVINLHRAVYDDLRDLSPTTHGDFDSVDSFYHESMHVYLNSTKLMSRDVRRVKVVMEEAARYYENVTLDDGSKPTDPAGIAEEAACEYVAKRASSWWNAYTILSGLAEKKRDLAATRKMLENTRKNYDGAMKKMDWGYQPGGRQRTSAPIPDSLAVFLDEEILLNGIPRRFANVAVFQNILKPVGLWPVPDTAQDIGAQSTEKKDSPKQTKPVTPPATKPSPNETTPVQSPPGKPDLAPTQPQRGTRSIFGRIFHAIASGVESSTLASGFQPAAGVQTSVPSRPFRMKTGQQQQFQMFMKQSQKNAQDFQEWVKKNQKKVQDNQAKFASSTKGPSLMEKMQKMAAEQAARERKSRLEGKSTGTTLNISHPTVWKPFDPPTGPRSGPVRPQLGITPYRQGQPSRPSFIRPSFIDPGAFRVLAPTRVIVGDGWRIKQGGVWGPSLRGER